MSDRDSMMKAFWKLSGRDKIVLLIAAAVLLAGVCSLVFFLMTGFFFSGVKFPGPSLISEQTTMQGHEVRSYGYLDVPVNVPGTGYGVNLRGEEMPPASSGAAFNAGDGLYTVAGYLDKSADISSFATNSIPEMIEGTFSMGSWQKKVSGSGYLNSVYAEYYGGIITTTTDSYYCLFYRYPGKLKDMVFGTVRTSDGASTFRLTFDKRDIDKMFFTVVETGEELSELPPLKPLTEATVDVPPLTESTESGAPVTDSVKKESEHDIATVNEVKPETEAAEEGGTEEEDGDTEDMSLDDEFLAMQRKRKEEEFALQYPGQEIFKVEAEVPEELNGKEVGVDVFFTEANTYIKYATIRNNETGRVETAAYLNDTYEGRVVFFIPECESGTWTVELERAQSLGAYDVSVLEGNILRVVLQGRGELDDAQPRE